MLCEHRAQLRWWERGERAEIDTYLARNADEQLRHETRLQQLAATRGLADATDHEWLTRYGPDAACLVAVDQELRARDAVDERAALQLDALDRDPLTPEPPALHPDIDLDLGP